MFDGCGDLVGTNDWLGDLDGEGETEGDLDGLADGMGVAARGFIASPNAFPICTIVSALGRKVSSS